MRSLDAVQTTSITLLGCLPPLPNADYYKKLLTVETATGGV